MRKEILKGSKKAAKQKCFIIFYSPEKNINKIKDSLENKNLNRIFCGLRNFLQKI